MDIHKYIHKIHKYIHFMYSYNTHVCLFFDNFNGDIRYQLVVIDKVNIFQFIFDLFFPYTNIFYAFM